MNRNKLVELYKKYDLEKEDVFKHQHFVIITRQGIEKIQAKENKFVCFKKTTPYFETSHTDVDKKIVLTLEYSI